ncbi:MAG: hypothetical protein NT062_04365 [Proteobacteria bacterium]|nr:hypothetical protein [Pseudomonadota bacterium]
MPNQMLVTCPDTAHLEQIELEEDSYGRLIVSCSRFEPASEVTCPRTCAARLDRRDRAPSTQILCVGRDQTALVMVRRHVRK